MRSRYSLIVSWTSSGTNMRSQCPPTAQQAPAHAIHYAEPLARPHLSLHPHPLPPCVPHPLTPHPTTHGANRHPKKIHIKALVPALPACLLHISQRQHLHQARGAPSSAVSRVHPSVQDAAALPPATSEALVGQALPGFPRARSGIRAANPAR